METRHIIKFILAVVVAVSVVALLTWIGPERIITYWGVENIYLVVFIFAIIGGVSAFSAAGFYATLFSLGAGGLNPFILAAVSAPGVLIGDFIFWYVGTEGRKVIESGHINKIKKFDSWLETKPKWAVPIVVYIYTGFTPFPGDFLMLTLALLKYRFNEIWLPTLLGNYTLALIVATAGAWNIALIWF